VKLSTFAKALAVAIVLPASAAADHGSNPMHPTFVPRDGAGVPTTDAAAVSSSVTCGGCHDAPYIAAHGTHADVGGGATCIQCHVEGGRLEVSRDHLDAEGKLFRSALRIGAPRPSNCAPCHGVVSDVSSAVALPASLAAPLAGGERAVSITLAEGAIVAPQRMRDSFLDLAGKDALASPWDVHAAKLVECTSCHFAANDPAHTDDKRHGLRYVARDPRRVAVADFLARPDHRLARAGCRDCHDALASHEFLPYRARHMEVLACATCHIAAPRAPAAELVDETLRRRDGAPLVVYRNVDARPGEAPNAALVKPLVPLLVDHVDVDGATRLAPVNLVSRYRWVSGRDAVTPAKLVAALYEGDAFAPPVVAALDRDGDGRLGEDELRLDTPAKAAVVAARLAALGVDAPRIEGSIDVRPLAHGVTARAMAERSCEACHSDGARRDAAFPVAPYLPGGVPPSPPAAGRAVLAGAIADAPSGGLEYRPRPAPAHLHILGATRHAPTNRLGFALFLAVAVAVTVHGVARVAMRRRRRASLPPHAPANHRVYVFGRYERLWHWTMALSGLALIVTGVGIHNAGAAWAGALPKVVLAHNVASVVLSANAFLALFYHLSTAAIRTLIPRPEGFLKGVLEHVAYQSRGIFHGDPHPEQKATEKLNPLQQVTYLALLNLLFPLQIATGVLLWAIGRWPELGAALGGLSVVAPVHNLGAWLFMTFFVLHVYLVTTGPTVGEHLASMITGYRHADPEEHAP
jgi:thiosulfate reductase cytochrome b subunit